LYNLLQSINTVVSIGKNILVKTLYSIIMILYSRFNLILGIFRILQAPSFGVVLSTKRRFVVICLWCMVHRGSVVDRCSMVYNTAMM